MEETKSAGHLRFPNNFLISARALLQGLQTPESTEPAKFAGEPGRPGTAE